MEPTYPILQTQYFLWDLIQNTSSLKPIGTPTLTQRIITFFILISSELLEVVKNIVSIAEILIITPFVLACQIGIKVFHIVSTIFWLPYESLYRAIFKTKELVTEKFSLYHLQETT